MSVVGERVSWRRCSSAEELRSSGRGTWRPGPDWSLAAAGRVRGEAGQRSALAGCCGRYRFSYLVARRGRERGARAGAGVLAAGQVVRSRWARAGSVICGGRSWGATAGACGAWRGGPGTGARAAYWSLRAPAAALPHEWSPVRAHVLAVPASLLVVTSELTIILCTSILHVI